MSDFLHLKAFECDTEQMLKNRGLQDGGAVQKYIDTECLRLTNEKMPKDTGALIEDSQTHTIIGSGTLRYRTVYARRLYYHPEYDFQGAPERGAYAFERMKQQYKDQILAGAQGIADGKGDIT